MASGAHLGGKTTRGGGQAPIYFGNEAEDGRPRQGGGGRHPQGATGSRSTLPRWDVRSPSIAAGRRQTAPRTTTYYT